jgi:hypothetical protein
MKVSETDPDECPISVSGTNEKSEHLVVTPDAQILVERHIGLVDSV